MPVIPHPGGEYAITVLYALPDDAWCLELDLVGRQRTLAIAIVPDEDPAREPTLCFDSAGPHVDIPWDVMRWFTEHVEEEIRTSRAWMRLRPDLVRAVHELRQEYLGAIDDEELERILPGLRAAVGEADLPTVLEFAFGRSGTEGVG
ncbi:hypothetical protein [Kitasatospora terrestris]|uniref:Uncharacterized protein n=1 Tax=Kitasatospora terrestris TaxID=258051 RepID=A0ABP9DAL3_9ACTN